jgi:hypothetical protein
MKKRRCADLVNFAGGNHHYELDNVLLFRFDA